MEDWRESSTLCSGLLMVSPKITWYFDNPIGHRFQWKAREHKLNILQLCTFLIWWFDCIMGILYKQVGTAPAAALVYREIPVVLFAERLECFWIWRHFWFTITRTSHQQTRWRFEQCWKISLFSWTFRSHLLNHSCRTSGALPTFLTLFSLEGPHGHHVAPS